MTQQLNIKTPLVFKLGVVLLVVLMLTFHMTGGLYARYSTTASGGDSARVAKFDFEIGADSITQFQNLSLDMAPGENQTVQIKVQNKGEVALRCVVTAVNLSGNLPIQIAEATGDLQNGDIVAVSRDIGIGGTVEFDWTVVWPEADADITYVGKIDVIKITVAVEQID